MMNKILLMGRLTADPELRQTPAGVNVATFRVAVDRDYTPKGGERQADFIPCVAWRQTGEFVSRYFQKGRMIALEGSLQTRCYEVKSSLTGDNQEQKRTAYEVIVEHAWFCGEKKQEERGKTAGGLDAGYDDGELPW